MKKFILIIAIVLCNFYSGIAQTNSYVLTPNESKVTATIYPNPVYNWTKDQIDGYQKWLTANYNAVLIGNQSNTYNCHGYAWDSSEVVKMDYPGAYWTDGSYEDLSNTADAVYATHVYYDGPSGNHSALITDRFDPNGRTYTSKWGLSGGLVQHAPTSLPQEFGERIGYYRIAKYDVYFNANGGSPTPSNQYQITAGSQASIIQEPTKPTKPGYILNGWATSLDNTIISFLYKVKSSQTLYAVWVNASVIIGPSLLCYSSSATFSAQNWQSGYYWDKSNSLVNISNPSSSSTAISVASSSSQGAVTLSVKNSSGTTVATHNVWVGAPDVYIYPNFTGSSYGFTATPAANTGVYLYSWGASPGSISGNGTSAIYDPYGIIGWHDIWVTAYNNCGSCTKYSGFSYYGRGGSTFIMNPNTALTEVEIIIYSSEELRSAGNDRYTVTVFDSNDAVVFQGNYLGKKFIFPISNLSNGTYTVEVGNGTITNTQQLVIKR